jgi:hypothetical protein
VLDAIAVAGEWIGPIELVDGCVKVSMRFPQFARHHVNVIEIGEG